MRRKIFLTVNAIIALGVSAFALIAPDALLESKGVIDQTASVWVREVGALIFAAGVLSFLVRSHRDSATLKSVLIFIGLVHFGLFPIEVWAYGEGIIKSLLGIIPNSVIHLLLSTSSFYFALKVSCGDAGSNIR